MFSLVCVFINFFFFLLDLIIHIYMKFLWLDASTVLSIIIIIIFFIIKVLIMNSTKCFAWYWSKRVYGWLLVSLVEYAFENYNTIIFLFFGWMGRWQKNLESVKRNFPLLNVIFCSPLLFQFNFIHTLTRGTNFLLITGKMIMC